jgi:hypothetical protein
MDDNGPRTEALANFHHDLDQSFLIANLISEAGVAALDKLKSRIIETEDESDLLKLKKESEDYLKLGSETDPNILLILLMTKFEAYVEDIAVLICTDSPHLVDLQAETSDEDIRTKIKKVFFRKRLDQIADFFNEQLGIFFIETCKMAKTSPSDLDKAKAIRNILIHNRGRVDNNFKKRFGDQSLVTGQYFPIHMSYLDDLKNKIFLVVWGLDIFATRKYGNIPRTSESISPFDYTD